MDATPGTSLTPFDVLHMCRKFLRAAHYEFVEDIACANWLINCINEQIGDTPSKEPR